MSLKQSINIHSIKNARELGGYKTADGREVKRGLLLRTAALCGISDEDIRTLKDTYRLRHIVDLRMDMELPGAEDPVIDGTVHHHLDVIDPSVFITEEAMQEAPQEIEFNALDPIETVELSIRSGMLDERMYIGFLTGDYGLRAYSDFFRIMLGAEPDRAVLWHCTSGKDRTGLAAMLLLSAFGVDEETILEDHLLTNEYNAERIAATKLLFREKGCDDDFIEKAAVVFDAVNGNFMRVAMAFLKQQYGSVVGYIRDGLNISQEEIDSLKEKYLQ